MARARAETKTAGIGDAAVKKATGKTWAQWLRILDAAGAKKMTHKDIAANLRDKYPDLGGWWAQMVTVGYEQARGMRLKHEKCDGFAAGASKTVGVPVAELFRAFKDKRRRGRWLPETELEIRKATPNKSLRITWSDGQSSVNVNFYEKGAGKSQIAIQHEKLPNAKSAERLKKFWRARLGEMKVYLEE